jgi:hypothetical protein
LPECVDGAGGSARSAGLNFEKAIAPSRTQGRQPGNVGRPCSRVILVFAPLSSRNTRRRGSILAWATHQPLRRAATSGRSCSAARGVYFERQTQPTNRAPDCPITQPSLVFGHEPILQPCQRDIRMGLDMYRNRHAHPPTAESLRRRWPRFGFGPLSPVFQRRPDIL